MMKASNVANVPTGKQSEWMYIKLCIVFVYIFCRCERLDGENVCTLCRCTRLWMDKMFLLVIVHWIYVTYVQCFCLYLVCKIMNTVFVFVEHRCTSHCWQPPVITSGWCLVGWWQRANRTQLISKVLLLMVYSTSLSSSTGKPVEVIV